MNQYSRQFLRDRFLADQQDQMARDAELDDPTVAYLMLIDELWEDAEDDTSSGRAA